MTKNQMNHQNIMKKERFVLGPNGRLYRIARNLEETPDEYVNYLYNKLISRFKKK